MPATRELADPMGLRRRTVGAVGRRGTAQLQRPADIGSLWLHRCGSHHSHVVCCAELSDEQCRLVDFIRRRLWLSDRCCALDRTKEARLVALEHRELARHECLHSLLLHLLVVYRLTSASSQDEAHHDAPICSLRRLLLSSRRRLLLRDGSDGSRGRRLTDEQISMALSLFAIGR